VLKGGEGYDIYYADDGDTIEDTDGSGEVWVNGKKLSLAVRKAGEKIYHDDQGNTFVLHGNQLQVNDPLTITGFQSGMLGIELKEERDPDDPDDPLGKDQFDNALHTVSPIVLDLDGNGVVTRGIGEGAFFDFDGNGFAERTGWATPTDGLLVRDLNHNGKIDNGTELFGEHTILANGRRAVNGFAALADLDTNGDRRINANDKIWSELKIWRDADADGVTDDGELSSLSDLGIESIAVSYQDIGITDSHGNNHKLQSSFTKIDGTRGTVEDVWFRVNPSSTREVGIKPVTEDIAELPDVAGIGNVASLHQAMMKDPSGRLQALVQQFGEESDPDARTDLMRDILFAWSGVADQSPGSRGEYIDDGRIVSALEAFYGINFMQSAGTNAGTRNPGPGASAYLSSSFAEIQKSVYQELMQQTHYKDFFANTKFIWHEESNSLGVNLDGIVALVAEKIAVNKSNAFEATADFISFLTSSYTLKESDVNPEFFVKIAELGRDVSLVVHAAFTNGVATSAADILNGGAEDDILLGLGGADRLYGNDGNDELQGNSGNDNLQGGAGNDTLIGGSGADVLAGGDGNDVYLFNRGDGQDTISNYAYSAQVDILQFGVDILPDDLIVTRNYHDLVLTIRGTSDRVTVLSYFYNDGVSTFGLNTIKFADSSVWDFSHVNALALQATEGNDALYGNASADTLEGLGGNDSLYGFGGNDTLIGGAGDDTLDGGDGVNVFDGGSGNDTLLGTYATNIYLIGPDSGMDRIQNYPVGLHSDDVIKLTGQAPADITVHREVNDLWLELPGTGNRVQVADYFLYSDQWNNSSIPIMFDDGTVWDLDVIKTFLPVPTDAGETIYGYGTSDVIDGLGGDDIVYGCGGDDVLSGGSGNDRLVGSVGNDVLDGGDGQDTLEGGGGNNVYRFESGSGIDTIVSAYGGSDVLKFGEGIRPDDIQIVRYNDGLIITTGTLGDRVIVNDYMPFNTQWGLRKIEFADGTVWGFEEVKTRLTLTSDFDDYAIGSEAADTLDGRNGNDIVFGFGGDDLISGGNDDDVLYGGAGNDTLTGDKGNDKIDGGDGNDVLAGGAGDDILDGNAGTDTYLFSRGDGSDTVATAYGSDVDVIVLGPDIARENLSLSRNGNDLVLVLDNDDGSLLVQNFFIPNSTGTTDNRLIRFQNGEVLDRETLGAVPLVGSAGADYLQGDARANRIDGADGVDNILGNEGNDTLGGGAGDDALYGDEGDDVLDGGTGNDYLAGEDGNDVLDGGAGNDYLAGGSGNDVYLFGMGSGRDAVGDAAGTDGVNVVRFGPGITAADLTLSKNWNNLVFTVKSTGDELTIGDYFGYGLAAPTIGRFEFDDGTTWQLADVAAAFTTGSAADDRLAGFDFADILDGMGGDDVIYAGGGNDTVLGGAGNDTLYGETGNDVLQGSDGNDALYGGAGNDTLVGGTGNDVMDGGDGDDVYVFARGNGGETIARTWMPGTVGSDTVRFAEDVLATDIDVVVDMEGLHLRIRGTDDQIVLESAYETDANPVKRIEFVDGTSWLVADLIEAARHGTEHDDFLYGSNTQADILDGLAGDDRLFGKGGDDQLGGGAGDDILEGEGGNDVLLGGAGNDVLSGDDGSDVYLFDRGDGQDRLYDYGSGPDDVDVIRFGEGISAADVSLASVSTSFGWGFVMRDLVFRIKGSDDRISIADTGNPDDYQIEKVEFADGTVWDKATLNALPRTILGSAASEWLGGDFGDNTFEGGAGDDSLGGDGGSDTYLFNRGDGKDAIYENGSALTDTDIIRFGEGITPDDITLALSGTNLVIGLNGTEDSIAIQYWAYGDWYYVERIEFANGATWDQAELQARVAALPIAGTDGDDYLYGDTEANTLQGGHGNDMLYGGQGSDTYLFDRGDGVDTISDGDYDPWNIDTIRFGDGISAADVSLSLSGNDLVLKLNDSEDQIVIRNWGYGGTYRIESVAFADGVVWDLPAQASAVPVVGTDGDDYLYGDEGGNTLAGGAGNDWVAGWGGSDTYLFNLGDGHDTISDMDFSNLDTDTVRFGDGITPDDIVISRNGPDLLVSIGDAGDAISVERWGDNTYGHIERFEFSDGTVWDAAYIHQYLSGSPLNGTPGDDYLTGWTEGDVLAGGAGSDYLQGGYGDDVYLFNRGDGQDTISEDNSWETPDNVDIIRFGSSIVADDITVSRQGSDLVMTIAGGSDRITVAGWGDAERFQVERVEFADGSVWTADDLQQKIGEQPIVGTAWDDYLTGWSSNDVIKGGAGNDVIEANGGNDLLEGGRGNDMLDGGSGADTYVFSLGDGHDSIADYGYGESGLDVLRFGAGITEDSISFTRDESSLVLRINGTSDQIDLFSWGYGYAYQIEQIEFANGTVWDAAALLRHASSPLLGSGGNDYLQGWDGFEENLQGFGGIDALIGNTGRDILDGGEGNDLLTADDGDDTLLAGNGNDLVAGGGGNDVIDTGAGRNVIAFNLGDGQDVVLPNAGSQNTISLGGGISYADLSLSKSGNDLVLVTGSDEAITFKDWYSDTVNQSVADLQIVIEQSNDYDMESASPLHNQRVQQFDFAGLVNAFDQARAADGSVSSWALSPSLEQYYKSGSNSWGIGGYLAYQYGLFGSLSNEGPEVVDEVLADEEFGIVGQPLEMYGSVIF
jgi:Ca2+-binding RTX toxin-like protein